MCLSVIFPKLNCLSVKDIPRVLDHILDVLSVKGHRAQRVRIVFVGRVVERIRTQPPQIILLRRPQTLLTNKTQFIGFNCIEVSCTLTFVSSDPFARHFQHWSELGCGGDHIVVGALLMFVARMRFQ